MTLRRVQVQGRDGSPYEFVLPEAALPHATNALRLRALGQPTMGIPSVLPYECNLQWFCSQGQDLSSFLIAWLDPESWLVFEIACRGGRAAIEESRCWESVTMGGHTLRFEADERKQAYVEHRRCVARVEKAFQDLRRFARFPDTVFNPGASLAETFAAEQLARVVFPDEVRASFVLFNGQARSVWLRSEVGVDDVNRSPPFLLDLLRAQNPLASPYWSEILLLNRRRRLRMCGIQTRVVLVTQRISRFFLLLESLRAVYHKTVHAAVIPSETFTQTSLHSARRAEQKE